MRTPGFNVIFTNKTRNYLVNVIQTEGESVHINANQGKKCPMLIEVTDSTEG